MKCTSKGTTVAPWQEKGTTVAQGDARRRTGRRHTSEMEVVAAVAQEWGNKWGEKKSEENPRCDEGLRALWCSLTYFFAFFNTQVRVRVARFWKIENQYSNRSYSVLWFFTRNKPVNRTEPRYMYRFGSSWSGWPTPMSTLPELAKIRFHNRERLEAHPKQP